jgi:hypothetical protein
MTSNLLGANLVDVDFTNAHLDNAKMFNIYRTPNIGPTPPSPTASRACADCWSSPVCAAGGRTKVIPIVDPENSGPLLRHLRGLAEDTSGVLLLYFVGHGVLSKQGELCLAITDTDHANPNATGVEYNKIKRMLYAGIPAATRIAILDCC